MRVIPKFVGDRAGVQRPGASESDHRELTRIQPALDGYDPQHSCHSVIDQPNDAGGRVFEV